MSGVSAVYILDRKGRILICRQYKSDLPSNIHEKFAEKLLELDESTIKPMLIDDSMGISFFHKKVTRNCSKIQIIDKQYLLFNCV